MGQYWMRFTPYVGHFCMRFDNWTEARAGVAGLLLTITFRPEPRGRGGRGAGGVGEVTRVRGWHNQKLE